MDRLQIRILLIEDDEEDYLITRDLVDEITTWRIWLDRAATYDEAVEAIKKHEHDVCLVDYRLGAHDGLELLRQAVDLGCRAPMILLTGLHDHDVDVAAMKSGAADYLSKGRLDADQLERSIRYALERRCAQEMLKQANHELTRQNDKLRDLTETAHRFVDNVAHEFRTPLTVIKEFTSIIADGLGGPVSDQQTEYLRYISSATRDLAQMVSDFLDSSKLKAGSLRVDRQSHRVEEIFEHVRPALISRATEKGIALVEEIDPAAGPVFADLEKAGRVVINLVVNAIKFSPESSQIRLWASPCEDGGAEVGITDQGPGLSPKDQQVIFQRFKQVGDVERASTKGFGLGLNIAKELIWLNLGTVHVRSQPDQGSTFSFTLPPTDPGVILDRYFDRLVELANKPVQLAVLRIEPVGHDPQDAIETVHRFMAAMCYPMDLLLRDTPQRAIVALGSTPQPDHWLKRLQACCRSQEGRANGQPLQRLEMACLGAWGWPGSRDEARACVLSQLAGQEAHVQ